jgi:ABC-type uncharacterized transport system ATPase subunit
MQEESPSLLSKKKFLQSVLAIVKKSQIGILSSKTNNKKNQIKDILTNLVKELSNNLKEKENIRMKLMKAFYSNKKIMGIDEPFKGLNNEEIYIVAKALKELVNQGKTIIVVDHEEERARHNEANCRYLSDDIAYHDYLMPIMEKQAKGDLAVMERALQPIEVKDVVKILRTCIARKIHRQDPPSKVEMWYMLKNDLKRNRVLRIATAFRKKTNNKL